MNVASCLVNLTVAVGVVRLAWLHLQETVALGHYIYCRTVAERSEKFAVAACFSARGTYMTPFWWHSKVLDSAKHKTISGWICSRH
jgi:hypothetical protein